MMNPLHTMLKTVALCRLEMEGSLNIGDSKGFIETDSSAPADFWPNGFLDNIFEKDYYQQE